MTVAQLGASEQLIQLIQIKVPPQCYSAILVEPTPDSVLTLGFRSVREEDITAND